MKKTSLAILSAIVIGVSMVFAFTGAKRAELSQDVKVAAPLAIPELDAVSVQVAAVTDAQATILVAPMDTQADILINEVPLMLGADGIAADAPAVIQAEVDGSLSGMLTAGGAAPPGRAGEQADENRSVQDALQNMLVALDRLSQQAAVTRKSVALLVGEQAVGK